MRRFLLFAVVCFGVLLALPGVQMVLRLPLDWPLQGAEAQVARPSVSWGAWWGGAFQREYDDWLGQRIGLRGWLVRTANQLRWSLFGELPSGRGTQVLAGKDGFLFEKAYVDAYAAGGDRSDEELREVSRMTRRLQDFLAGDGIAFLLVVAPSKAEVYPEYLPDAADVAGRGGRTSTYEGIIDYLHEDGVNVLDAHELFLRWRREEPELSLLFAKGGTHWNRYGAARVVERMTDRLRELTGRDIPGIRVVGSVTNRTVVGVDNDLGDLANQLWGRRLAGPQVHPVLERVEGGHLPRILFVGDSFIFTLTEWMDERRLYENRLTYYYYNRQFTFPETESVPLNKRELDILAKVREYEAVVIEINEYWLPRIGFGIVKDLLRAYGALPPRE